MNTTLKIFLSLMILNLSVGLAQDTQQIQLTPQVARLVVTDLIEGDSTKDQLKALSKEANLLYSQIILKDSIISKKDKMILNYEEIIGSKSKQLQLQQELTNKLKLDLKKTQLKNKLTVGAGIALVIGAITVL